ncbi:MAG TPA: acetamidase/formamidase family protein [Candidatus Acidoferrales bacterium]|nr:acetamidase/formamidase family protein [Candidatus Acidoferrales bacterium]
MRRTLLSALLCAGMLFTANAKSQDAQKPAPAAEGPLSGHWIITAEYLGAPVNLSMEFKQDGNKLTGNFDGDKLEGTVAGSSVHFLAKDDQGGSEEGTATVQGSTMSGTIIYIDGSNPTHPVNTPFTAKLAGKHSAGAPQTHEFTPTVFYREFSPTNKPVLTVNPGDTIHTTTVDAGGNDEKGVPRVMGGNPETGPFYIESAEPGDTLVVHLVRLRLNRDWAMSDDFIVSRAVDSDLAVKMKDGGKTIRWHLDTEHGVATPEKPAEHLTHYFIPLKPMLGCIAVAPGLTHAPPPTGDSGNWGGNVDFNEIVEGAMVYLPVGVPGALLYVGDGHAVQGDGELNGNALETSMDVTFTVDVIPGKRIPGIRVESPTHVMAMGLGGSLEDALRAATSNMAELLATDYKLTPSEVAQVLGTTSEYKVSELADRNAGVVLKINKARLQSLPAAAK